MPQEIYQLHKQQKSLFVLEKFVSLSSDFSVVTPEKKKGGLCVRNESVVFAKASTWQKESKGRIINVGS